MSDTLRSDDLDRLLALESPFVSPELLAYLEDYQLPLPDPQAYADDVACELLLEARLAQRQMTPQRAQSLIAGAGRFGCIRPELLVAHPQAILEARRLDASVPALLQLALRGHDDEWHLRWLTRAEEHYAALDDPSAALYGDGGTIRLLRELTEKYFLFAAGATFGATHHQISLLDRQLQTCGEWLEQKADCFLYDVGKLQAEAAALRPELYALALEVEGPSIAHATAPLVAITRVLEEVADTPAPPSPHARIRADISARLAAFMGNDDLD